MIDPNDPAVGNAGSTTAKMRFNCGSVYLIINDLDGRPFRAFLKKGHSGLCVQALLEAIGRLLTIILQRTDLDMARVWKTLVGITCESGSPLVDGLSCMDGLARKLNEMYPDAINPPPGPPDWGPMEDGEPCAPTD